ncbi:ANR family transcriptional regulator [Sodalis endosymbiont of Spalangia cameroni]|uniref:ANR family transcriptional regulator n=1 Tax=Sodalis praecaptivus TaxID=1239307 RepID=UPI0031F7DAAE
MLTKFKRLAELAARYEREKHWLSAAQQWDAVAGQSTRSDNDHWARCRADHCRQQAALEEDAE